MSSTAFDYFMHFGVSAGTSTGAFFGRLQIKSVNGGNNFRFGIQNTTGGAPTQTEYVTDLNFGETYLIVVKYDLNGSNPDIATLWVNPSEFGGAEPSTGSVSNNSGTATTSTAFGSIALRNGSNTPNAEVDEIRVGTSWADVTPVAIADNTPPTLVSFTPANAATNVPTNTDFVLTFSEPVVAGTGKVGLTWSGDPISKVANEADVVYSGSTVTIKNTSLQPNTTYTAFIENTAFKDAAGNFYAGLSGTSWSFTTAAAPTPVLTPSVASLAFPALALTKSVVKSYDLSAANVTGDVTVSVTGPFEISKTDGSYATTPLVFTRAELAVAQKVYVRFTATNVGSVTGSISHTSTGAEAVTVNLSGLGIDPYNQNFNDPNFLTNSGWMQISVTGAQVWASTNFGRDCLTGCNAPTPNKAAQINGFVSGAGVPNEDWLISPQLDLTTFTNMPVLQFWTISAFAGNQLKLMYSADYSGTGNPSDATWTEVQNAFPASNSNLWTLTQGIELPKTAKYVAFVYTSTTQGASRWTVDDVKIQDLSSFNTIPTATFSFGEAAMGTKSAAQSLSFRAVGYGAITVTAPAGFEVSADNGTTFASSVVIPETEAAVAAGKTVQVRFAPSAKQLKVEGTLSFTGTGLEARNISLVGSSYLKSETFDVATYNMEFFGNGTQIEGYGPANAHLQIENATTVLNRLNMDIVGIEEISDETALAKVIADLPGSYAKQISPVYSYSIKPNSSTTPFPAQKIGFIYNTATVTPVGFRVMFEDMYRKAVAGTTTQIDDDFWSSGRLPYMGTFDVTVGGITKRIRVIDIHAKSGGANADFNRRVNDLKVLKDTLDMYYANHNVILLGDYNDNVVGSINAGGVSSYNSFVTDVDDYMALTKTLAENGGFSFPSSNSFLDHIIISNELTDDYLENSTTVEDPRSYVTNYSNTTSDHLPVYARFAFTANDPLGTKEDLKSKFRISPNPTTGAVTLQLPVLAPKNNLSLTLYNLRGEVVLQTAGLEQTLNQQLSQALSKAPSGMYLVKVQAGTQVYQTRIIKK
ncbi:Ig-like domain-containing protein [Rufibacter latericius]|uniref:Ig-like domain-containing protein n=1 Tax=Rufibacter latericius TaxID=2487040 RepID=UPI0014023AC0|nr:Ig-like domain-containing protein [Rufibacter latericius]